MGMCDSLRVSMQEPSSAAHHIIWLSRWNATMLSFTQGACSKVISVIWRLMISCLLNGMIQLLWRLCVCLNMAIWIGISLCHTKGLSLHWSQLDSVCWRTESLMILIRMSLMALFNVTSVSVCFNLSGVHFQSWVASLEGYLRSIWT